MGLPWYLKGVGVKMAARAKYQRPAVACYRSIGVLEFVCPYNLSFYTL